MLEQKCASNELCGHFPFVLTSLRAKRPAQKQTEQHETRNKTDIRNRHSE